MSIEALSWAIKTCIGLGLSGNAKLVLWQIADHHNVDNGAFLRQDTIAKRCEISRATVNRCLDDLEAAKLIRRQSRIHPVTKQQLPTRYYLGFEEDLHPQQMVGRVSKLDTENRGPTGEPPGEDPVDNLVGSEESRVSNSGQAVSHSCETLTFLEPKNTPLPPDPAGFDLLVKKWPTDRVGNEARAEAAFERLGPDDRAKAIELAEAARAGFYALKREVPRLATYLDHRGFAEFDDAPPIEAGRFKITPRRAEWSDWLGWIRKTHGQKGVDHTVRTGFFIVETRWPPATQRSVA